MVRVIYLPYTTYCALVGWYIFSMLDKSSSIETNRSNKTDFIALQKLISQLKKRKK